MVAYKLSKNGWVMPFFVIFRLVREKLLVTVALDHPVVVVVVCMICIFPEMLRPETVNHLVTH